MIEANFNHNLLGGVRSLRIGTAEAALSRDRRSAHRAALPEGGKRSRGRSGVDVAIRATASPSWIKDR